MTIRPTIVPGLSVRRLTDIIHDATGTTLLTLPAGLTPPQVTGLILTHLPAKQPGVVSALGKLDWTGPLTGAHAALAATVQARCTDLPSTLALIRRQRGIHLGIYTLNQFIYSARGRQIQAAHTAQCKAAAARAGAHTPQDKAHATRCEQYAATLLNAAGLTPDLMARMLAPSNPTQQWTKAIDRMHLSHRAYLDERATRIETGRAHAGRFLRDPARADLLRDLATCVTLTCGYIDPRLRRAPYRTPREQTRTDLGRANALRVQRRAAQLPLDPAHPDVRALTRPARLEAARALHDRFTHDTRPGMKVFEDQVRRFYEATQFKTRSVRAARLQECLRNLENTYHDPLKIAAVLRGLRREVLRHAATRAQWGDLSVNAAELPAAPPRQIPGAQVPQPPAVVRGGVTQPSLF